MSVPQTRAPRRKLATIRPTRARKPESMLSGSVYSLISKLVGAVFTAALTLYLVRALGPRGYGGFSLAVGVGALVSLPADFGVSSAAARFAAEARGRAAELSAIVADSVRLKVVSSLLVCGALIALAGPIAGAYHASVTFPLRMVAIAVAGQNFMFLFLGVFPAVRNNAATVSIAFGESAVEFCASVALVLLGGGLAGAAAGRAIGYTAGALLSLVLGARAFGWPRELRPSAGRSSHVGRISRYAAPLMLVASANALFANIDLLLIGAYLDTRHVGLFNAPLRLLVLLGYPGLAVASAVAPRMARSPGHEPDGRPLERALRALVLIQSLMIAPMVVWAHPMVRIVLGHGYSASTPTVQVLAISVYLSGLAPLVSMSANFLGDAPLRVPLMIAAAVLDGLIDVVLIPRIGIVSGAIATAAAYALMVGGHVVICRRHVRLKLGPVALSAARGLVAAAAMAAVMVAIGGDPGVPMLILGAVLSAAAFALVLVAVGELSPEELMGMGRTVRRLLARMEAP